MFSQKVGVGNLILTAEAEDVDTGERKRFEFSVGELLDSGGNVLNGSLFVAINATSGVVTAKMDPFVPGKYRLEVCDIYLFRLNILSHTSVN